MSATVCLLALCACAAAIEHAGEPDFPFLQDISHRSLYAGSERIVSSWDVLPFPSMESVLHLGAARDCFVSLSAQSGVVFSSGRRAIPERNKLLLESPYEAWTELYAPMDLTPIHLISSMSPAFAFYVVSADSLYGVGMADNAANSSGSCGQVSRVVQLLPPLAEGWGEVYAATASSSSVWVSSSRAGLVRVALETGTVEAADAFPGTVTSLLWVSAWSQLFAGSKERLVMYTYEGDTVVKRQHEWIGGIIDTAPLDMCYDTANDAIWLAEANAVHKLSADGRWWRYGQKQGAPFDNITSVAAVAGFVYVGSGKGLARARGDSDPSSPRPSPHTDQDGRADPWQWQFYGGNRYLPDNTVVSLTANAGQGSLVVVAATDTGLALMEAELWTLAEKARAMGQFQEPRHDRRGLVADCQLQEYGDVHSYLKQVKDNDGLWTTMHGMGEAYRFMATGEPEAQVAAWRAFEAAELLSILPGAYPAFPARSYCVPADGDSGCGTQSGEDRWHASTIPGYEEYLWKDDTSSDEIDGHLAFYPMVYDHIASTPEEKARAYRLIEGITGGILENGYYLIDPVSKKPTTWGFWSPAALNGNPQHYSERGGNSVEILGYLASAYSVTGNKKYKDAFWDLAVQHGYIYNAMNAKVDSPEEDNHSDNELIYLGYHVLLYSLQRLQVQENANLELLTDVQEMVSAMTPSLERSWSIVRGEKSPLWLGIYAGTGASVAKVCPSTYSDAVWTLRRWAVDLISWPVVNSERWDLNASPFTARDSTDQEMQQVVPPQERETGHWNGDPYKMDGGSGNSESEPSIWRLPYYLLLYNRMIV